MNSFDHQRRERRRCTVPHHPDKIFFSNGLTICEINSLKRTARLNDCMERICVEVETRECEGTKIFVRGEEIIDSFFSDKGAI